MFEAIFSIKSGKIVGRQSNSFLIRFPTNEIVSKAINPVALEVLLLSSTLNENPASQLLLILHWAYLEELRITGRNVA